MDDTYVARLAIPFLNTTMLEKDYKVTILLDSIDFIQIVPLTVLVGWK